MNHPHLVLQGGMDIDLERSPDIGMAQHLAQALDVHTLLHAARRIGVPLRYNNDKPENPSNDGRFEGLSHLFHSFSNHEKAGQKS